MVRSKLVFLRHGESKGNKEGFFTGRLNVDLTEEGEQQAYRAGEALRDIRFERAYTSELLRAQRTLDIALTAMNQSPIITKTSALNEREYGNLTGLKKEEAEAKFGKEQIQIWRRSYREGPPNGESIEMIGQRAMPFYVNHIAPHVQRGENALVVAHAGTLIAMTMRLDGIDEKHIHDIKMPNSTPIVYDFDSELGIVGKEIRPVIKRDIKYAID